MKPMNRHHDAGSGGGRGRKHKPVDSSDLSLELTVEPDPPTRRRKPLIGITMGDPCGIGAEVIVKALADPEIRRLGRFMIYGIENLLFEAAQQAGVKPFWFRVGRRRARRIDTGVVVADYDDYASLTWEPPRPTREGGQASLDFLSDAVEAVQGGQIDAIVTAPINKTSWKLAKCRFPGHTELLAEACHMRRYSMAFVGGGLRVALASMHMGLFEVQKKFNIGMVFQPIDLLNTALRNWFAIETPRIAVAGLNPHAGEGGRFGDEEARVIEPAMQMATNAGISVEGPLPPDTLFTPRVRGKYDGIVAMYHDQGLIPIKMLAFDSAVNVTLGLPIIRTSVDHGTAFDIVGRNQADPGSMKEAIRLACTLARNAQATQWAPTSAAVES